MKPKEIQDLLEFIAQSGLEEVNIETEDVKITTKKSPSPVAAQVVSAPQQMMQAPLAAPQLAATPVAKEESPAKPAATDESKYKVIKSPMIGTFYRSPGPNEDVFVNIGDTVSVGSTVCIIEAMKLFNEIESEFAGKIVKMLVQDATPVEYDQPLFYVEA